MNKRKVTIGALVACVGIVLTIGHFGFNASAKQGEVVDCDIESNYSYGEEFTIPDGKVSYNGEEKESTAQYLVFPSGKANESDTIVLSEEGKYELVYTSKFDGATVLAKKSFIVNRRILSVTDEKSSAELVDNKIEVSLASGDVFTYQKILDVSKATKNDPFLNLQFTPNTIGQQDVSKLIIRITDVYDENNYITLQVKEHLESTWYVYLSAGANDQPTVGVEKSKDRVYKDNRYGTAIWCSMQDAPKEGQANNMLLYYDNSERALYTFDVAGQKLVADFDDMAYFEDNLWKGFSADQVKLSIYGEGYYTSSCGFVIDKIYGESDFNVEGDEDAPYITVTSDYEPDELPTALVGKPYKIFDAKAVDNCDDMNVTANVYYKYFTADPVKVSVKDGAFTPSEEGTYVIEYNAEDASGNVGKKILKINATQGEGLQFEVNDIATETNTGQAVKVMSGINYTNNSGKVVYSVTAKNLSTDEEVEIDLDTLELLPMSDGDWEVTVAVQDYLTKAEKTFVVKSNHTSQPQVFDNAGIQKYFILGATYTLPELSAYDFSSGKGVKKDMDIFVTESGAEEIALADGQYIPKTAGDVKITYRLIVDGCVCEKTYVKKVVDVGYGGKLNLSSYFVPASGKATVESSTLNVKYNTNEDTVLDFINFVQVENMELSFEVGEQNAFKKINVYLTDIVTGKQVKLTYNRTEDASVFSLNDGYEYAVEGTFDGINRSFNVAFNNDKRTVSGDAAVILDVKNYLDGSKFKGFTNSVAMLSIELEDVYGASQLIVSKVNAHGLNNMTNDRFGPQILVDSKFGDRAYGDKVELTGAFVYDTLDPSCSLKLTVTDPKGNYLQDTKGVVLDGTQDPAKNYVISLKQYGNYQIKYLAVDGSGTENSYEYAITSKDVSGPELKLKRHKEKAKVGEEVKIAKTKVKDNFTKECETITYVFNPDGATVKLTDGTFVADMSGTYTVRYMAFDEDGNYTFTSYEVVVR